MLREINIDGEIYRFVQIKDFVRPDSLKKIPFSLRVLLENIIRLNPDKEMIDGILNKSEIEIPFSPTRVLMQDFSGIPAVADLAAMRDAVANVGGDARKVNPLKPVDLVIDHSVMIDFSGGMDSFSKNMKLEYARNQERYTFFKWAQRAFDNMRIVPPGVGICHQVNIEYLAKVAWVSKDKEVYMDTVVGTDSHTTMVNGLGVLGWGVGGIEAEAVMLGSPIYMMIPKVVGVKLKGKLPEGVMATDLVLTITQLLRAKGVVGKFVEFYGEGYEKLSLPDRATLANMAPEYGATCGYCPIDQETIEYLKITGRSDHHVKLVEAYAKEQGLWYQELSDDAFDEVVECDLASIQTCLAGPKRPQDRVLLKDVPSSFPLLNDVNVEKMGEGSIVIAAITSCTNTSNPYVLIAAGLVARKARALGLKVKPWVKTSFAPGSQVVGQYLTESGLQADLDAMGFSIVAHGCTTCIGNSGPLSEDVAKLIDEKNLTVAAVLSGNRNFEGRIHAQVKANYLASPPLVVAYALAGNMMVNLAQDPLGEDDKGNSVYLKDVWPQDQEVRSVIERVLRSDQFCKKYDHIFEGDDAWKAIQTQESLTYAWDQDSTYIQCPPYFDGAKLTPFEVRDIKNANILAIFGDSITTDHISPAGSIKKSSPAGKYLSEKGVDEVEFNSYGSRRGNHEVMVRGTFANTRIQNEMTPQIQGGFSRFHDSGDVQSIYDVANLYNTPLVIFAGKEYGTGSSRDWAAKGSLLLGVKAVVAQSFERIHRSNLVGMGILPLLFDQGQSRHDLQLLGNEKINIIGLESGLSVKKRVKLQIISADNQLREFSLICCLDTEEEIDQYRHQGVLLKVFRALV